MGNWLNIGGTAVKPEEIDPSAFGFVYVIENLIDGRRYIGKKRLRFTRRKLKKGKKVKVVTSSDWETYYGSSKELQADVKELGEVNFSRMILRFCNSAGACSYWELYEQMMAHVLLHPDRFYNNFVGARIHRKHVLRKEDVSQGSSCK